MINLQELFFFQILPAFSIVLEWFHHSHVYCLFMNTMLVPAEIKPFHRSLEHVPYEETKMKGNKDDGCLRTRVFGND